MIPTPIRQVLFTIQANGIRALLMGGQACVFYGAAQVSKDIDFLLLADEENFGRFRNALDKLKALRIAVPRFNPEVLARGHAVHFRCQTPGTEGIRIDIMTKLRGLPDFESLWERRTIVADDSGTEFNLLSVPDLVDAKKTQRSKDWPMIEALVAIHFHENRDAPTAAWIEFWLKEARSPDLLIDLATLFPVEIQKMKSARPLLTLAINNDIPALRIALDTEIRAEQEKDRIYWEPLKREMEAFRREERTAPDDNRHHGSET